MPEPMSKALVGVLHELKTQGVEGRYVPVKNMHMTLAFIGETDDVESVKAAMSSVKPDAFRLTLDGFGFFGDTLWAGVKGNQKIKKYVSDLRLALKARSVPCDSSRFEPHITLVRGVKGRRPAQLTIPKESMTVSRISLMRSDLKDGKRVYREIWSLPV